MLDKIQNWFSKAWDWIKAVWAKHDAALDEIVQAILPMVVDVAFRVDLSGEQKRKAIVDSILDNAQVAASEISTSILNEAVEIAANRYNIQIGKLTVSNIETAKEAALLAGRKFANGQLKLSGKEAESAGVVLGAPPTPGSAEANN